MRIVFFGTPEFAVPILQRLIDTHEVAAVVSQPDKPKGRGKKVIPTPVKLLGEKYNIPVIQPKSVNESTFKEQMREFAPDIIVLAAFGQLIPEELLRLPRYGFVNVHASLLPKYRGAAPIQRAIIDGESVTGVTIMYMVKELDAGDMILKKPLPIEAGDTYGTLHDKMASLGADAITEAIEMIERGEVRAEKQDDSASSYAHKITKEMGELDFSRNSKELVNLIRGLNPNPGAYTFYKGEKIKVYSAKAEKNGSGRAVGSIIRADKNGIAVKTGSGALIITEIQAANSKKMSVRDYLLGHKIDVGQTLGR